MKTTESKLKKCKKCGRYTTHKRNVNKSSGLMIFIHFALTVITAGLWLIPLIIWLILFTKIGGWKCESCSK